MKVKDRNSYVLKLLYQHLENANNGNYTKDKQFDDDLETLFSTQKWGFREITLVIVIAHFLNPSYKASVKLYECKPRALYEKPIRKFLRDQNIPHRKSGPLNVAKSVKSIDENWSEGKRPKEVAQAVVSLNKKIEKMNINELENFLTILINRFAIEATRIDKLNLKIKPSENPILIFEICKQLINETPDGGNTPQRICGLALKNYLESIESKILIGNYEDSASVTNTTSKKPGDIIIESHMYEIKEIYEITCKPFDEQRLQDSYDSIKDSLIDGVDEVREVYVICREQDCPELDTKFDSKYFFGTFIKNDIIYYFIDIYEWLLVQLLNMSNYYRMTFHNELSSYISEPNTSESVKVLWNKLNDL